MTNIKEVTEATKTVFDSLKKVIILLKDGHYIKAIGELLRSGKLVYTNHLKGKRVNIIGQDIPLTLVILIAVLGLYIITPTEDVVKKPDTVTENQEINTFDNGKIKVYDMRKNDNAVKGTLENYSEQDISHVKIVLTFHDETGETIYQGGVETDNIPARSRMQILVQPESEFSYFRLVDVMVEE